MDQPPLAEPAVPGSEAMPFPMPVLPAGYAGRTGAEACVVIVRTLEELRDWVREAIPSVPWIQVEGLLDKPEAWIDAARVGSDVALDVVVSDPLVEYPMLYRLVDVQNARGVRVTIPLRRGFFKALRLATALHLPVRLLPGQPDEEELGELMEAVHHYLHSPMAEVPVEFFHSAIGWSCGASSTDLWMAVERDPAAFPHFDGAGSPLLPAGWPGTTAATFVEDHVARLERNDSECVTCAWKDFCRGYFKLPDPEYSCGGIVGVFDRLGAAAKEIAAEIGDSGPQLEGDTSEIHP